MAAHSHTIRGSLAALAMGGAFVVASAGVVMAAPGHLDRTFSHDGQQFVDFRGENDFGYAVALQSGRILIAGITGSRRSEDLALARLNKSGTINTNFGHHGRVRTDLGGRADEMSNGLAVLSSGKILVAGDSKTASGEKISVVRYRADGRLDGTFGGGDGKVLVRVSTGDAFGYDLGVQSDGKFIVVGESDPNAASSRFLLVRFDRSGRVDSTFGSGGIVRTRFGPGHAAAYRIAVLPNDKIVACGWKEEPSGGAFDTALVRYRPGGELDAAFGGDGKVTRRLVAGDDDYCDALALRPRGRVLLGEHVRRGGNQNMGFLQYRPDGALDTGFSGDGKQVLDLGGQERLTGLALQRDGRILASGRAGSERFSVVRLGAGGKLDSTFGNHGVASAPLRGSGGEAFSLILQSDGKIVVAGDARDGSVDFAAARFRS
jgi:uncharacterized delta-60 repeat protein